MEWRRRRLFNMCKKGGKGVLRGIVGYVGTDGRCWTHIWLLCSCLAVLSRFLKQIRSLSQKIHLFFYTGSQWRYKQERNMFTRWGRGGRSCSGQIKSSQAGRTRKTGNQQPCFSFSRWNRPAQRLEWEQAGQFQPLSEQCSSLWCQPGNPQLESGKEHRGECLQSKSDPHPTKQYTFTQGSRAEMDFISRNPRILKNKN